MSAVSRAKVEQTAIGWPDRALCSAAASVDVETDAKVQTMIRDVFGSCTVFAIAHRLVSAKPPATPSRAAQRRRWVWSGHHNRLRLNPSPG